MSTKFEDMIAEEMFRKLGYIKDEQDDYIVYWKLLKLNRELQIEFNYKFKTIEMRKVPDMRCEVINIKELQAINQQINELGW